MTSMLRRMIATAAIPMLLAGCGMSVLGHRSDVTKPAAAKETKAKAKTAPKGTKESEATSEREMPKDHRRRALGPKLIDQRPSSTGEHGRRVALRLQRSREVPQVDLHTPDGIQPRYDIGDVQTSDPFGSVLERCRGR